MQRKAIAGAALGGNNKIKNTAEMLPPCAAFGRQCLGRKQGRGLGAGSVTNAL